MECKDDKYLQEDLEIIAGAKNINWSKLKDRTVFVTGATGLVGSQVIKALLCVNRISKTNISIVGLARDEKKVIEIFDENLINSKLEFIYGDICNPINYDKNIDYIIHGASVTASKFFVEHPVETMDIAINGTKNILELARLKEVRGMVYLSSMEVFGRTDQNLETVLEKDLGYIDVLNIRSCYSEGKRTCECLCSAYASEYGVPVKIARLSQTFGAGITKAENRVFAQFAKSAINKTNIVLHTNGQSEGNYTYLRDTIIALFVILERGNIAEAYTVVNEQTNITIVDMAKMVANEIAKGKIDVVFDIPEDTLMYGYAPETKMKLSSKKLRKLGWEPTVDLLEAYLRMIESIKIQK